MSFTDKTRNLVTPELEYIRGLYAQEDALLAQIRAKLEEGGLAIQIGAEEGRLLQLLIAMNNVKNIVEIGTLAGYSTIWMARALAKDGHIYTINRDENHIKMARENFAKSECEGRIIMLEGDAHKVLPTLDFSCHPREGGDLKQKIPANSSKKVWAGMTKPAFEPKTLDMVFIDADKISYNDYLDWAEENLRVGGLLVADNVLLGGSVAHSEPPADRRVAAPTTWQNMKKFNTRLADKSKYNASIIPTKEGLVVAVKL